MNKRNCGGVSSKFLQLFFVLIITGGLGYFFYNKLEFLKDEININSESSARRSLALIKKIEKLSKRRDILPDTAVSVKPVARSSWIGVQNRLKNTVVKIVTDVASFNWIEPYKTPAVGKIMGSGFFIDSDGHIVTNYHNISQARLVQIEIPALGVERLTVNIVGVSPERDLALLSLTNSSKDKIEKELGEIPFVGRERISLIKQSCIQTTAPLNPGNSGGPAIDSSGKVIGINFAGVVKAQNVGYIIPINDVKSAIKDLRKIKLLRRPVLGCLLEPSNAAMLSFLENPEPGGFYVAKVYKNMIFEKVGVLAGDMIYEMNGFELDRFGRANVPWNEDKVSMVDILARLEVGDKIDMVIYRKGERKEIDFVLEPRAIEPIRFIYPDFEDVDYETIGGLVFMELAQNHLPLLAEHSHFLLSYEAPEKKHEPALILSYVQPTSIASRLRLFYPGVIIEEINGQKVKTLKEFRDAVRSSKNTRFFTVKTVGNFFAVFSTDNIVNDEDRLANMYQFKMSNIINEIA